MVTKCHRLGENFAGIIMVGEKEKKVAKIYDKTFLRTRGIKAASFQGFMIIRKSFFRYKSSVSSLSKKGFLALINLLSLFAEIIGT